MAILIQTKGPKKGRCNICGNLDDLTEDHTPPKGCKKPTQVNLQHITAILSLGKPQKGRISQNGVKYRTLCASCNNGILGGDYDPEFVKYVNTIGTYLKTDLKLPNIMTVKARPQRIMKALLGHLCAQGVDRYDKGPITDLVTDYILNKNAILPDNIKIYNWIFPYRGHVMARDCAWFDLNVSEPVVIWFLKFFPIAFLVTFEEPKDYLFDFVELSKWRNENSDFEVDIDVVLKPVVDEYWPESPSKTSMVMYGQEAITSFSWTNNKCKKKA